MLEAAGIVAPGVRAGLNMHRACHTFATDLRRIAGIEEARQALGHSDLNTTLSITATRMQPTWSGSWSGTQKRRKAAHLTFPPPKSFPSHEGAGMAWLSQKVEAAGIEPASADAPDRASTSVVCAFVSPGGRFADDLPTG